MTQGEPTIEQKRRPGQEIPAAGKYAPIQKKEPMRQEKRETRRHKLFQRTHTSGAQKSLFGSEPHTTTEEREKHIQTHLETWGWKVQEDALQEAARRDGPLAQGGLEAQLKRISEQATQQAQEQYQRTVERHKELRKGEALSSTTHRSGEC